MDNFERIAAHGLATHYGKDSERIKSALHRPGASRADLRAVALEIAECHEERASLQEELAEFYRSSPIMAKPEGSAFHKLLQSMKANEVIVINNYVNFVYTAGTNIQTFVVEHNWASALSTSKIDGEPFVLPYSTVCFEFVLNNRRVCALALDEPGYGITVLPFILLTRGWVADIQVGLRSDGKWEQRFCDKKSQAAWPGSFEAPEAYRLIGEQIRAVSVSLEAEVAVSDVIRAPHKLNVAREKRGALPISDYHVVSLSRKSRARSLPREDGQVSGRGVRLHFRRGHWRHYENSKTWIKWMLVGDPDLGFIDKHYRV